MTGLFVGMALTIIVLIILVAFLADDVIRARTALDEETNATHDECIDEIKRVISKSAIATAVYQMAEHYDSVAGERERAVLQRKVRREDSPSIPAAWMQDYATKIDPQAANVWTIPAEMTVPKNDRLSTLLTTDKDQP